MISALHNASMSFYKQGAGFVYQSNALKGFLKTKGLQPARLITSSASGICKTGNCTNCCSCVHPTINRGITSNPADKKPAEPQAKPFPKAQYPDFDPVLPSANQTKPSLYSDLKFHRILEAEVINTKVKLTLANGETLLYPSVWLRDNCQCKGCFNPLALGRSFLMEQLIPAPKVDDARVDDSGDVEIGWMDGHKSVFKAEWLMCRAFTEPARLKYRNKFSILKKLWSSDHTVSEFSYPRIMEDDKALLEWLTEFEVWGATLLKETPSDPAAAYHLCERVAKTKYTHFGLYSSVVNHPDTNNLAYTNQALNLHNDMPQYNEMPGVIFLHMVKQHRGEGGDTVISDGLHAGERMRQLHPALFKILTTTDVYFWDKGQGKHEMEMQEFYKINKGPTIQLDNRGDVTTIRFNNQVRDSFLDLPEDEVEGFYEALQTYFRLMCENGVRYKMDDGDMTVLDNVRCQHGRMAYDGDMEARHLVTTFMSWDEAACRRRRLQEKFGII